MPWPRLLATATVPFAVVAIAIGIAGLNTSSSGEDAGWFAVGVVAGAAIMALGIVIARRQPPNAVGALLAGMGLLVLTIGATDAYAAAMVRRPGVLPVSDAVVSLSVGGWIWFYVPVALLCLVFPDGRYAGRRDRAVGWSIVALAAVFTVMTAMDPRPYPAPLMDAPHALGTLPSWVEPLGYVLPVAFLGLLIGAAVSLGLRLRRAVGVRRAQLKWFALAGASVPATLLLCWASYLLFSGPDLVVVLLLMWLAVPAATGIAMLRHDLYDVDRATSTAVTYALLSAVLLATFTMVSFLGGIALGRGSPIAAAAATAVCAVALQPVRRSLQGRVERRIHPLRQGTMTALEDLRRRTRAGAARPEELEDVLRRALRDPGLRVGYLMPGGQEVVDADARPLHADPDSRVPIRLGNSVIGVLVPGRDAPRSLIVAVADASALLAEVVRLRLEVSRALSDVEGSRTRLLHAGYVERRRLERDLHDGAQQRLVSLGMSLRLAQRHARDGDVDVDALLDTTVAELATSVAELRQLAHGLRPSSLDDGLEPALVSLTSRLRTSALPIRVTLDVRPEARSTDLSDDVSTTAYYVASEAVANIVKHAEADSIDLSVARDNGSVRVRIADNGRGGAAVQPGSGLAGLQDRVAAIGGSLVVASPLSGGTIVEAVLPCGS